MKKAMFSFIKKEKAPSGAPDPTVGDIINF